MESVHLYCFVQQNRLSVTAIDVAQNLSALDSATSIFLTGFEDNGQMAFRRMRRRPETVGMDAGRRISFSARNHFARPAGTRRAICSNLSSPRNLGRARDLWRDVR
jgi:hypothetical protein